MQPAGGRAGKGCGNMAEKRTGAVILAAGRSAHMEGLKPMMKLGRTTMIQKEIDTLRQAGITPIVVVTGYQAEELERHIAHRGAVCVRNKKYETSQMFDLLLGDDLEGRKEYISDYGHLYLDAADVS